LRNHALSAGRDRELISTWDLNRLAIPRRGEFGIFVHKIRSSDVGGNID
jgi:hypothetical protein